MTDKAELLALALRVEQATGPDRELDAAVAPLQGIRIVDEGHPIGRVCYDERNHGVPLPAYTASLDSAMTLIPEGVGIAVSRYWINSGHGPVWSAKIVTGGLPDKPRQVFDCYGADSAAIAVVVVALRTLASEQPA